MMRVDSVAIIDDASLNKRLCFVRKEDAQTSRMAYHVRKGRLHVTARRSGGAGIVSEAKTSFSGQVAGDTSGVRATALQPMPWLYAVLPGSGAKSVEAGVAGRTATLWYSYFMPALTTGEGGAGYRTLSLTAGTDCLDDPCTLDDCARAV